MFIMSSALDYFIAIICILSTLIVYTNALLPLKSSETLIAAPMPSDLSAPLSLTTQQRSNLPLSQRVLKVQCDADHYGRNLNVRSCTDIFSYMDKDDRQTTFAQRHSGIPKDIPLPWRVLSGK